MKTLMLLRQAWSIDELRLKLIDTLKYTAIFLVATGILIPGVVLAEGVSTIPYTSMLVLGLGPYISATVIVGFFTQDEDKRRVYSRYVAILIALIQAPQYYTMLSSWYWLSPDASVLVYVLVSVAGTSFTAFLSEKITEKGICRGRDLLMGISTLSILPQALFVQFQVRISHYEILFFIFDLLTLFGALGIALFVGQTLVRIPVKIAPADPESDAKPGNSQVYMKLNPVDDYPINFSGAILYIPLTVLTLFNPSSRLFFFTDTPKGILLFLITFISSFIFMSRKATPARARKAYIDQKALRSSSGDAGLTEEQILIDEQKFDKTISGAAVLNAFLLGILAILPIVLLNWGCNMTLANYIGGASIIFVVNFITGALYNMDHYLKRYGFATFQELCRGRLIGTGIFYLSVRKDKS